MQSCPKCGYQRLPKDMDPYLECPRCGIVFAKFAKYHLAPAAPVEAVPPLESEPYSNDQLPESPWYLRLWDRLMELPEQPNTVALGSQALVLAVMVAWGIRLISYKLITADILYSFWHEVD